MFITTIGDTESNPQFCLWIQSSWLNITEVNHYITKTSLFKYTENFTTKKKKKKKKKNENFQIKILIFFLFLLLTQIVCTR